MKTITRINRIDIILCPLCLGERGHEECSICGGEGVTFTWAVFTWALYEYNEKKKEEQDACWARQRKLLEEKDKFINLENV